MHAINRRGFMGWAAVGAAGLVVPELVKPRTKVFDLGRHVRPSATRLVGYSMMWNALVFERSGERYLVPNSARQWMPPDCVRAMESDLHPGRLPLLNMEVEPCYRVLVPAWVSVPKVNGGALGDRC